MRIGEWMRRLVPGFRLSKINLELSFYSVAVSLFLFHNQIKLPSLTL